MTIGFAVAALVALITVLGLAIRLWRLNVRLSGLEAERDALSSRERATQAELESVKERSETLQQALQHEQEERRSSENARDTCLSLLDALPEPVWRRDRSLALEYCNEAYLRAVGLGREEVLRQGTELVDGNDRTAALQLARRALDNGEGQQGRMHVVAGGRRCLMELTEAPLPGGCLVGHARDVTELEELQGDIARHAETTRTLLEKLGVGIAMFGADMHLSFHNAAYAQIWHLDEAFLAGKPHLTDIYERLRGVRRLPEQVDFTEYKRQRLRLYQNLIEPREDLIHLPDGSTLRLTVHPHPFGGVIFTFEDVTDRLQLERRYNTLLEVQRETLDKLYEGIAVYGANGRLRLFNPAFARIWQQPEELLASEPHVREIVARCRDFFDLPDEAWPAYSETIVARATEPEAERGRRERADGSVIDWAQVPLPDGASLFTFLDVTDSMRVERALRERNEALETTDRLKSEFIANISYELRTPLNAIIGFAEILQNQYFGDLNERQIEYSRAIVEASQRLTTLINDILDLASIEAGYLQLDREEVDIFELLTAAQGLWRERARARGLELSVRCPIDIGTLHCDERRLTQALFNILSNSFKFTPEGGSIELAAERSPGEVLISVRDTGIGISPDDQARVFGKFERGRHTDGAAQGRQQGAGLGLSLVKSLIELHGGWIELESAVDRGTKVTCHLSDPVASPTDPDTGEGNGSGISGAQV